MLAAAKGAYSSSSGAAAHCSMIVGSWRGMDDDPAPNLHPTSSSVGVTLAEHSSNAPRWLRSANPPPSSTHAETSELHHDSPPMSDELVTLAVRCRRKPVATEASAREASAPGAPVPAPRGCVFEPAAIRQLFPTASVKAS